MYTCEIFLHHFLLLSSTSTTEPHSSAQFGSYSQSFVLLKSQHISLYLHFYSVVLYASFCLSHTHTTHYVLDYLLLLYFLFNANNISIQINTRILGFLSFAFCFVALWRFYLVGFENVCVYAVCVNAYGCVPVRKIHKNAGGWFISFSFPFVFISYVWHLHVVQYLLRSSLFHFFPLLFYLERMHLIRT